MDEMRAITRYPSKDKPWLKYYDTNSFKNENVPMSMYELLFDNNKNYMSTTALNYYDRKITYKEMFSEIAKVEKAFWKLGIRENDVVVICSVNTPEVVYSLYALNHIGAIVNMVDPRSPIEYTNHYINEGCSKIILCIDKAYPLIKKAALDSTAETIILISPSDSLDPIKRVFYRMKNKKVIGDNNVISWSEFIKGGKGSTPQIFKSADEKKCSIMAHTGGTTGIPKTVLLSSTNLNSVVVSYKYLGIPFERGQRYFNDLPPFIIYGLTLGIHIALCYGQEVILYPVFDSKGFPELFAKYKPNHFSALSDHLKYLIEHPKIQNMNLDFLISAGVGGDSLNQDLEKKVNLFLKEHGCKFEVCKGYGMSELSATGIISFKGANDIGSVGVPLIINNIRIVDIDTKEELSYNQTGELWIKGPSIMLGYLDKLDETEERISIDENGERWIHTGDIAHITQEGLVYIEGRLRRIYLSVVNGQPSKIYPNTIESIIRKHPKVYDCCAVGRLRKDSTYYEIIVYVVKTDKNITDSILSRELFQLSDNEIPSKMRPVKFCYIEELPVTPIGKVDYRKLENAAALEDISIEN